MLKGKKYCKKKSSSDISLHLYGYPQEHSILSLKKKKKCTSSIAEVLLEIHVSLNEKKVIFYLWIISRVLGDAYHQLQIVGCMYHVSFLFTLSSTAQMSIIRNSFFLFVLFSKRQETFFRISKRNKRLRFSFVTCAQKCYPTNYQRRP